MYKLIKRLMDIVLSLIGLIILSPLLVLVGILIKLDSKGPVFFLQERLGYNGEIFKIIKFRTMIVGAESIGDGLSIKSESDDRITMLGSFLRKTSIDELPQLINVLKGDMSLVGPRPPVVYHPYDGFESYPTEFKKRFKVKPGITGLAQVRVRNSATWDDRIVIDNEYVSQSNLMLDIKIILGTIKQVFIKQNIY